MWRRSVAAAACAVALLPLGAPRAHSSPEPPTAQTRTRVQVEALIAKIGKTPPPWFKKTKLRYPKSLDLSWPPNPPPPWNAQKNVGQFLWSVVNENPSRWKEGIRFLHHLLVVNQEDPDVVERTMEALGRAYYNLHEDWPRAAFWWRKAGHTNTVDLADCYFKLGSKAMAVEILEQIGGDRTRNGSVIKLWSDLGEFDKALEIAEARGGDAALLAAGDACRVAGKYDQAVTYFAKVIALTADCTLCQTRCHGINVQEKGLLRRTAIEVFAGPGLDDRLHSGSYIALHVGSERPVEDGSDGDAAADADYLPDFLKDEK